MEGGQVQVHSMENPSLLKYNVRSYLRLTRVAKALGSRSTNFSLVNLGLADRSGCSLGRPLVEQGRFVLL